MEEKVYSILERIESMLETQINPEYITIKEASGLLLGKDEDPLLLAEADLLCPEEEEKAFIWKKRILFFWKKTIC